MSKLTYRACLTGTALFAMALVSAHAQTNAASTNAPAATAPAPIPPGEVPDQAPATTTKLKGYQDQITPDTSAQTAQATLLEMQQSIDKRIEEDKAFEQANPTLGNLQNAQSAWQSLNSSLNDAQVDLSIRVVAQHALLTTLQDLDKQWKATLDNAVKTKALPAIVQSIQQVQGEISNTTGALNTDLNDLYKLQIAVAQQAGRVKTGLDGINTAIATAQAELLKQSQPRLWNTASFSDEGSGIVVREKHSLADQAGRVRTYLTDKAGALLIHGILLALLIAIFFWIRNVTREHAKTESGLADAERIFNAPLATALLLALVASHWLYPPSEAPRLLWAFIGAVALVPTVHIIRRLISPELLPLLYATVVAYFIDQVRYAATPSGVFSRFVFLAELLAVCIFLLSALRSKRLAVDAENRSRVEKIVRAYLHAAFFVFLAAGFANVLGYVQLSFLVGNGMLESSYLAVIFYAAVRIVDALALASMSLRPISGFGMVRRHHDLVYHHVARIIRWIATVIWIVSALQIFTLRNPLWEQMQALFFTKIPWPIQTELWTILAFPVTVWVAFALSRFVLFALEEDVYPNLNLPRGVPYAISTMVHYTILVVGFFLALSAIGIHLSDYAVLAGAFGVGLGFGLQNIMNNFISGLILLFERPIKVGDTLQIDANTIGRVERIGIRASVILLTNGSELILPNGNLISNPVTNWTLSNCERLVEIPLNVAKTNVKRSLEILVETAKANSVVLKNPSPQAIIITLAAASTSLKLRCWIDSEEDWMKVTSDLSLAAQAALEKEGIALA